MTEPTTVRTATPRTPRTYRVDVLPKAGGQITTRLVKAKSAAGAESHVSSDVITTRLATQDDLIELLPGTKVEIAGEASEPAAASPEPDDRPDDGGI